MHGKITGPPKVPWFGSYIFMLLLDRKHLHYAVNRICQFYKSTVLGIHLGPYPVVIVNDSENVKKVLYHRDFDGRPDILMGRMRHPDLDLHGLYKYKQIIFKNMKKNHQNLNLFQLLCKSNQESFSLIPPCGMNNDDLHYDIYETLALVVVSIP